MAERNSNPLAIPLPIFSGEKYDIWTTKMKTYFLSQSLWNIVNDGIPFLQNNCHLSKSEKKHLNRSRRQNAAALFILQQAVDDNIFFKISEAETAKAAWDALKTEFQGNPQAQTEFQGNPQAQTEFQGNPQARTVTDFQGNPQVQTEFQGNPQIRTVFQGNPQSTASSSSDQDREKCKKYLPLYKAILKGDLESVKSFCREDNVLEARITVNLDTALHVAVGTGKTNDIVEHLLAEVGKLTEEDRVTQLSLENKEGNTVLSVAAIVGNKEAAVMIMDKDTKRDLVTVQNSYGRIPLIEAALHGQKEMVEYLKIFSNNERLLTYFSSTVFRNDSEISSVISIVTAGFYDLALKLLKKQKDVATMHLSTAESLLSAIAGQPLAFPSGSGSGRKHSNQLLERILKLFVPSHLKEIQETKSTHRIVLDLVRHLCEVITRDPDDYERASSILEQPLLLAAELGVHEVVEEIINTFPDAILFTKNEKDHNVFHIAVMNRREKVFQLIYKMKGCKHLLLMSKDVNKNNILHLAGKLAPKNQLNLIPGAALQMQRELQWFKEVERIVQPDYKEEKNSNGETPAMLFTEEHKELVKEGEKWMKDAAASCSVAAALIATVVFAAAITVPGDYNDNGQPNFYSQTSFMVFSISDTISLFSSIAAIIMFLSVLTARYAEDDFLRSLPTRLIRGLLMLFLSLISLMVAFCATVRLVFCDKVEYWIPALVCAALLPISFFAYSQYPLLRDVFNSTYRPYIFLKQTSKQSTRKKRLKIDA